MGYFRLYKRLPLAPHGLKRNKGIALPHPICYGGANSWPWAQFHLVPCVVWLLLGMGLFYEQLPGCATASPAAQAAALGPHREIRKRLKEKLSCQILSCPERFCDLYAWRHSGLLSALVWVLWSGIELQSPPERPLPPQITLEVLSSVFMQSCGPDQKE